MSRRVALRTGVYGSAAVMVGGLGSAAAQAGTRATGTQAAGQATRAYDFNQGWLFGGEYTAGAELPGHNDGRFAHVTVPHTVVPLSWADWDHSDWEKRWIYRKHFTGTAITGAGERVLLTFDGVMTDATVVLNGTTIATHQGGYLPWTTEITGHLKKDDNVLAVIVDGRWLNVPPNALPGGADTIDYLQPAGIYRDVTLQVVPRVYLADVFARPVNVLTGDRAVQVTAVVDAGAVPAGRAVTVTAELLTSDGVKRALKKTTVLVKSAGAHTATLTIGDIGDVAYWSPENPALYTVRTTVSSPGGTPAHTVATTIGFRQAVFASGGFYLNGGRYEIFGLNRHQLYPHLGMAAPARLQRRDALILKNELNVNMVRCSHYPQSPHFLDACDELGIMIWQEPAGWGFMGDAAFQQRFLDDVTNMVIRDRNRPSVIVWGARLNETKNYPDLYAEARRLVYAHDGSRQTAGAVTFHTTTGWAEDVFSYDDYHIVDGAPELYPPVDGVPYLTSEAVGAAVDPQYRWSDPPATLASQANAHALVHDQAQANPRYAGLLGWAGIDYYAAPNDANPVAAGKNWRTMRTPGVADVFRVPKPGASIYQSQVTPAVRPVIIPVFCWDNATPPGANSMIATNCDRLELSVNGTPWLSVTPDGKTFAALRYPPAFADLAGANAAAGTAPAAGLPDLPDLPDLQIDGYVAAKLVATVRMTADTSRDRLSLTAADAAITADGSDATAITVRATDAYGNRRPGIAGDVTLTLTGPGTLIADSPLPLATLGGVAGGFIRSQPGRTGTVIVTAAHATLGRSTVRVTITRDRSESFI
jgi:beta-galactosidase